METDVLLALLLITGLAFVIPILAKRLERFGIPIVVYEIVAGMIVGISGFNLIQNSHILTFLAEFGFAFLMFLSGLELDLRLLNPIGGSQGDGSRWTQPLFLGTLMLAGTVLLAFSAALFFAPEGATTNPLLLGLILSTTSLGVVVPVLKERHLTGSRYGQYILVAASIADFVTLLLLTSEIAILQRGLTLELLLIPTLLLIFMLTARFSSRVGNVSRFEQVLNSLSSATAQIRVRGAFALMVAWVVLAEGFGVELILGAFLAGAIAGLVPGSEDPVEREKLDAVGYGFFIPVFFIMVGAQFNLGAVLESTQGLFLLFWLVVVAFIVKMVPSLLLKLRFSWRETLGAGTLMSSRLSLIIAAAAIALSMGLISDMLNSEIILLAIISVAVSPFLFNRIYPQHKEDSRSGVIVIGRDHLTEYLVERLSHGDEQVTVICPDEKLVGPFAARGVQVIDDCGHYDTNLEEAGALTARVLLDITPSSEETLEICRLGKVKYGIPLVVTRISDVELIPQLQEMEIMVVQPELATAMALEGAIHYPTVFNLLAHQIEDIEVTEIIVTNPRIAGKRLGAVRLPGDSLLLSLQRDGTLMIPHGNTVLQMYDRLGLIGSPDSVDEAATMMRA
ncbi:MAG: cation:proton antiporter [Candidatus Promineifilaceae bacterium]|nr:cation:proton antiporter [Candidatus Promineifilaceae bacterium]